jgi:hypothetical protein
LTGLEREKVLFYAESGASISTIVAMLEDERQRYVHERDVRNFLVTAEQNRLDGNTELVTLLKEMNQDPK